MESRMAAAIAFENMKKGIVPVVFGSQKPKEKKSRVGIVSVYLLVSMILVVMVLVFSWDRRHSIGGKAWPVSNCLIEFHSESGICESCKMDSLGYFSVKLHKGRYKIILIGKDVPERYADTETTPFLITVKENLPYVQLQLAR